MPDTPLYLEAKPGDLITAENWNELQKRVRQDIVDTTQKAVQGVSQVAHAKDSDELDGKTADQLADDIVRRAVQQVRLESGYQQLFTVLDWEAGKKPQEQPFRVIEHKLGLEPLVDVYRLQYFPVVYRRDQQTFLGWANFYLFQKLEQSIRYTSPDNQTTSVRIQPAQGQAYRILWKSLLDRYHVKYDKQTSVGDLLTDFWNALLGNQGFDEIQYGHSPFLEKCCDDNRTVNDLDQSGDWDDIYLKMMPEKIAFFPAPLATLAPTPQGTTAVSLAGPANT